MAAEEEAPALGPPCKRCKENEALLKIRLDPVCRYGIVICSIGSEKTKKTLAFRDCYCRFITTKTVKRLEVLDKDTRRCRTPVARKYLVGLSFGSSSAALVNICNELVSNQLARRRTESFVLHVVHIDTDLDTIGPGDSSSAAQLLDRWSERYPRFTFELVSLTSVFDLEAIDWDTLPLQRPDGEPKERLRALFENLPSSTSRADILRLFTRHLLISLTTKGSHDALLLGSSTTALAELTLAETAKGRGFSLPWQVNDGPISHGDGETGGNEATAELCYPLRDLFRKELVDYGSVARPSFQDLLVQLADRRGAVVSHRDLSIEEVMVRYFEDVEQNYPSVVANVVRTTGKLDRLKDGGTCGVCGMGLDRLGDERWRGEIGSGSPEAEASTGSATRLCYGCERSIHG